MATAPVLRLRRPITELQKDYEAGNRKSLDDLMRAWKGVKELPASDPNSFFRLGGFHGEPFRGPGAASSEMWWGGYCQHGTVLFPTWHRAYLLKLEQALQSIPGCEDVMLPFWDEYSDESKTEGIPWALTNETYELDGQTISNPLRSFVLPVDIVDNVNQDKTGDANLPNYGKPKGYETVRYPLSGLVGTPEDQKNSLEHNAKYPDYQANVQILNANIIAWLTQPLVFNQDKIRGLVDQKIRECLNAPNFTLFSNTTSQNAWNMRNPGTPVTSLESPHNHIHLAVGGFDTPAYEASVIKGANGDMGENDTAALDPIFYFHHCFIDYVFWIWQQRHGATQSFSIDSEDPGAFYSADSPPPAGANLGDRLTMESPLVPFEHANGIPFTSRDLVDIEGQLGYTYAGGSLDHFSKANQIVTGTPGTAARYQVQVRGIDRSKLAGSFIIAAYARVNGDHQLIGAESVLSRWRVQGCANCQTRLRASAQFPLSAAAVDHGVEVVIHSRDGAFANRPSQVRSAGQLRDGTETKEFPFQVEIIDTRA